MKCPQKFLWPVLFFEPVPRCDRWRCWVSGCVASVSNPFCFLCVARFPTFFTWESISSTVSATAVSFIAVTFSGFLIGHSYDHFTAKLFIIKRNHSYLSYFNQILHLNGNITYLYKLFIGLVVIQIAV